MKQHIYYINGLYCAGCAMEFEEDLNKLEFVEKATVDFSTSRLIIKYDGSKKHFDIIKKMADNVEGGIDLSTQKITQEDNIQENKIINKNIIQIIISLIIVLIVLLFKFSGITEIILYLIAFIIIGYDILFKVFQNILKRDFLDENFLMGVATIAAFAISDYLEAIAIMFFYKLGEYFQERAVNKSRKSISDLIDIKPKYATLLVDGYEKEVDPSEVNIGDTIIVKPGERIALDGIVEEGTSYLDMKELTGESRDVKVSVDQEVLSGSINKNSTLIIKVSKKYEDSTIARILDLVENSSANKAKTENFISKFARIYTPVIVFTGIAIALIPPLFTGYNFEEWLYKALIFIVVSCPCALVISIPLGFFAGIGNASKKGILVKGANYLEELNDIKLIAFDKTGTLTKGNFTLVNIKSFNNYTNEDLLKYSAYAESNSTHPIGKAIIDAYDQQIDKNQLSDYEEIVGKGLKVLVDGIPVLLGNETLMKDNNIKYDNANSYGSIVYVAINNIFAGFLEIADELKGSSKQAIAELKNLGINDLVMLSGDSQQVADGVGEQLGINQIYAQLLPDQKVAKLDELKSYGKNIFVGDGINDAPILLQANVGIAMGGVGSDVAIEAADIIIMDDEISKVATAIKIAKKTRKIIVQNVIIALGIKLLVLILGVLGLAQIWEAVVADVGVTLVAILNTMRILYYKGDNSGENK